MKTIAISIEEELLEGIDRIARARGSRSRRGSAPGRRPNRSEVVRDAVRQLLERQQQRQQESRDRQVLAARRDRLTRQLEALVGEQAGN